MSGSSCNQLVFGGPYCLWYANKLFCYNKHSRNQHVRPTNLVAPKKFPHQTKLVKNVTISHRWGINNVLRGSLSCNPPIIKKRIPTYLVHLLNWPLSGIENYIIVLHEKTTLNLKRNGIPPCVNKWLNENKASGDSHPTEFSQVSKEGNMLWAPPLRQIEVHNSNLPKPHSEGSPSMPFEIHSL